MDWFFPKDADFLCKGKSWAKAWKKRRGLLKALKASESFAKRKAVNSGRLASCFPVKQWVCLFRESYQGGGTNAETKTFIEKLDAAQLENQFEKEGGGRKTRFFFAILFFFCLTYFCLIPKLYVDDWRWYVLYKYADGPQKCLGMYWGWRALLKRRPRKPSEKQKGCWNGAVDCTSS